MENYNEQRIYENFKTCFGEVGDARQQGKITHLFSEILFISVLAVIAGAEDFEDIADYAEYKEPWLRNFLELPAGPPSHDTFNRVLCAIDPSEFEKAYIDWVGSYRGKLTQGSQDEVIPIDGKTICNSGDKRSGRKPVHMVSAMSTKYGLILGQQKCGEKSNEITAIPALLDLLDIKGTIITIDAMGTQKKIEKKILDKNANYILALKRNQENLFKEVADFFDKIQTPQFSHYKYQEDTEVDKGHGRIETRCCITVNNLGWLLETQQWKGIKSIAMITSTVLKNGEQTKEKRYYISSLGGNANLINRAVRKHWHIENKLHWVLDVLFKEDYCRVRTGNGAENISILKRIALNKLKNDNSYKDSLKGKRKKAAWKDSYAIKIMLEMMK